jgi:dipeptidyl aminopeptidase/acylaminoacyl peptidase
MGAPRSSSAKEGEELTEDLSMAETHPLRAVAMAVFLLLPSLSGAQGAMDDYQRAMTLRDKYQNLAIGVTDQTRFIQNTNRFWYRKTVKGGFEFILVDADTRAKRPAFDHARLAAALSTVLSRKITAVDLPFNQFTFVDGESTIEFQLMERGGAAAPPQQAGAAQAPPWRCTLADYKCSQESRSGGRGGRGGRGGNGLAGPVRPPFDINGGEPRKSPDGKLEALVNNYNVAIRETGKREVTLLSTDGSEGGYYDPLSIVWSPDAKKIVAYKVKPGFRRFVQYVESSPEDQLQPKSSTLQYAKPGDVLDVETPVLFNIETKKQTFVDNALFPNPYDMSRMEWHKESGSFTFEYNQRGHQLYRVITVDAATGTPRVVIEEQPKTFFCYSGKRFRHDIEGGKEVVWMSERDGWNHLYLYDGATGGVKTQITKGEWVVRGVVQVDEKARQIYFAASGMYPGKDPYFVQYYRINLDGSGLTALTTADANHSVVLSPDSKHYVDTYSRVDLAPVTELRRTADASLVEKLESADITELVKAGWKPPEVFVAKGRDGTTDIWGVIYRPTTFDPARKYPVIENIYAGPQSSFAPKSFAAFNAMQAQADIGFIVVQIDGMGTSNRSKAFHDVAWKNIKDAGFPDRILWHKAAAARYPWYDITRVGLYGTSAGGQNALGGLLFFPDFYKAAVSSAGCHDNRMDKIWWNEQWMGWPLGPEYAESSNVDNAYRLQGKVLLVVGEMDQNVDPSSTFQVVNQLIKHNKDFELLVIPGAGHTNGGAYGEHKRFDFFTRHFLGVTPPEWAALEGTLKRARTSTNESQ